MYKIRKATSDDLQQLVLLFDSYRLFYKKESDLNAAKYFLEERINRNESEIFVSEEEGRLHAFVQLYPLFSSTRMKRLWLLNDLFVEEESRGKGISVALIDRCKQLCKETNACGLILETAKSNTIGNNLYPKTGFVIDSEHDFYSWDC